MSASSFLARSLHQARRLHLITPVAGLLLTFGCSGNSTSSNTPTPAPAVVSVTGVTQTRVGTTAQFTATVTGAASSTVTWQVNGVTGGSAGTGTISATGLYTAPASLPSPNTVTIAAVSSAASTPGSLTETLLNPIPALTSATATQSGTTTTFGLDVIGSGFINGAQIQIAGNPVTTTFVSATELTTTTIVPARNYLARRDRHQSDLRRHPIAYGHRRHQCDLRHRRCSRTRPRSGHLRSYPHRHPARPESRHRRLYHRAVQHRADCPARHRRRPHCHLYFHQSRPVRAIRMVADDAHRARPASPARRLCSLRDLRRFH